MSEPARGYARVFGQDIIKGEWGGALTERLTWVAGDRPTNALDETSGKILAATGSGTSIFDPVLCEIVYSWFCPPGGAILDPFAGGSVRGIVAAFLGYHYTGIDLRPEQIGANRAQAARITPGNPPIWIVGDSLADMPAQQFDFVFSCPPYADLEVYSDDPRDLSTKNYEDFIDAYRRIIAGSIERLKDNRFACFVVGDLRDPRGFYRNFVSDTIAAFQDAGARLYNEAILITMLGSLPIRAGQQFSKTRKLGKTHQNVLAFAKGDAAQEMKRILSEFDGNRQLNIAHDTVISFVKGDPRRATQECGDIEVVDLTLDAMIAEAT